MNDISYYSPQSNSWIELFPLTSPPARYACGFTSTQNGRLWVFAGIAGDSKFICDHDAFRKVARLSNRALQKQWTLV